MNDQQFEERVAELLTEEIKQPEAWWYLSFADEGGFKGAVMLLAHGITDAIMSSHRLGINPGGEVMSMQFPEGKLCPPKWANRLLTRADVGEFDKEMRAENENENENEGQ